LATPWAAEAKLESARHDMRNTEWFHMLNADVISMPDRWEHPWYAAWDLAFHTIALSLVDFDFAKEQLLLMLTKFQDDPHWRDLILFYEYFHGDNGAGLGASHQTGWTGLVAPLLDLFGRFDAKTVLETDGHRLAARLVREQVGGEKTDGK
jgi:hypothetical protein